ncbi:MAG: hypothetical protein IH986_14925 [Planctomycetes bacterium]|nr:hypothetical protein [Planctomycetota bacterium]
MKTIISITAVATLAAGLALADPPDERPRLQAAQSAGELILPLRIAGIGPDFKLTSPWYEYSSGGVAGVCGQVLAFDIFEGDRRVQPSPPTDGEACGGYDPRCGSPGECSSGAYRWFFGTAFHAPMIINDFVVEPGMEGLTSDRIQFAWFWGVGGPGTSEQCFIAVFTAEDFSDNCFDPAASNGFDGVVLDFGVLGAGTSYYWTDIELCLSGLFLEHPVDGAGAYTLMAASDFDPVGGTFTPPTLAQFMFWGMKPDSPGEHPSEVVYVDTDPPFLEIDPVLECNLFGPGFIPCPMGNMGYMFNMYLSSNRACAGLICGDTNCDGRFDGGDIDPFFLALVDPVVWQTRFPLCELLCAADINGDGAVNGGDIDPFFVALARGGCSP